MKRKTGKQHSTERETVIGNVRIKSNGRITAVTAPSRVAPFTWMPDTHAAANRSPKAAISGRTANPVKAAYPGV